MMGQGRLAAWAVGLAALVALPFVYRDPYHLHILVLILIWSFAYTSWSMMGRFWPGLARPWRLHGDRRLCHRAAVESSRAVALDRHSRQHGCGRCAGADRRLSLLPLPHHRTLFRAGDAGAVRHRAPGHHGHARLYRRLARLYAEPRLGQQAAGAAIRRQDDLVSDRARGLACRHCGLALGRPQHEPLRAGGDLGGRGRRGRRRRRRHRGEAERSR